VYASLPLRRAGQCSFGRRGVTNGIRADPRGCGTCSRALRRDVPGYGSVCGHLAHGACGSAWDTRHGIWRRHWMYGCRVGPMRTSGPLRGGVM
jgi:hypothetical protein